MRSVFIYSSQFEKYQYPADCPFNISRAARVHRVVNSMGLLSGSGRSQAEPDAPQRGDLEKFHTARYLDVLENASRGKWDAEAMYMGIGTPDCPIFKDMYDYSVLACAATLTAAKLIISNSADVAFNPSGGLHHAGAEKASGFCYLNDVAIGCMALAEAGKQVLYLDVDVHHGDGVQNAFYNRSDVMTISFHESPMTLFPGTGFENEIGTGHGKGHCVNVPLPAGTYDQVYLKAFEAIVPPLVKAFKPDVIVFELGADGLADDPLSHLQLTNNTYADIIYRLLGFNKPILMAGGGGYNIDNTVRAWALAWSILCGADAEDHDGNVGLRDRQPAPSSRQQKVVKPIVDKTIEKVKSNVFGLHGL